MIGREKYLIVKKLRSYFIFLLVFSPSLVSIAYFGLLASDRYVSEAQFVVRTWESPGGSGGLSSLLDMVGIGRAQEEVFKVQSFMSSRESEAKVAARLPIREIYSRPEADLVARFPSLFFGPSAEELHKYLGWMIDIVFNYSTGVTTLSVEAFRAEDANSIARVLLDLAEEAINVLNARIQNESVRVSEIELKRSEARLIAAQQAVTRFRNEELIIDPSKDSAVIILDLIGHLSEELARVEAQIREASMSSALGPQLPSLRQRAEALQSQIRQERSRISSNQDGIADKLAVYERLTLEREFATKLVETAARSLESAQQAARRQQLFLERVVEPVAADCSMAPQRARLIGGTIALNFVLALVSWLMATGWSEHASKK